MTDAVRIVAAMRERLTKLKITDRSERDISEMRALSELITAIDNVVDVDGPIIWKC